MENEKAKSRRKHYPLIRTIYLYLFALIGLVLLTIGAVRFIDMGLKAFVFTKADVSERFNYQQPMAPSQVLLKMKEDQQDTDEVKEICLSEQEKAEVEYWLTMYKKWNEDRANVDYIASRRHRDASTNLSLILVGLPLFLFHWRFIQKETKDKEA